MAKAFWLSIVQLADPAILAVLWRTLVWTIVLCSAVGFALYLALHRVAAELGDYGTLAETAGAAGILVVIWFCFVLVENAILLCYAERIIRAVERRHYPGLIEARRVRWLDFAWSGVRLLGMTLLANILVLPLYLLLPGANLFLFLTVNGYVLGRAYFDAVALRRLDDRSALLLWRADRWGFVLDGVIATALLTVPVVNLVVPIIGLAAAVHLFERRDAART